MMNVTAATFHSSNRSQDDCKATATNERTANN